MTQSILECIECGYERSTEQDGRTFHDVCRICYSEECKTPVGPVDLCDECFNKEQLSTER
jgi:hypothetical protein